jgi:tRNA pseudouridine55 synthase
MDGLLLVDKPAGPTSHDVVARMRRVLGERRIGHTGTLDPGATGLLPLVLGRATRLARFLSATDKTYEADLRLGVATDSGDTDGRPVGAPYAGPLPSRDEIEHALEGFRGTYLQQPPALSARKIAGRRSYTLARKARLESDADSDPIRPAPTEVTVSRIEILACEGSALKLLVDCSAGFYVRSLAHELGQRLRTGAHLSGLRRTRTGTFTVEDSIALATAERQPERARAAIVPMVEALRGWSSVVLTADGVRHACHGRDLGPADFAAAGGFDAASSAHALVRLIDGTGELVGIAEASRAPGLLHPSVILR